MTLFDNGKIKVLLYSHRYNYDNLCQLKYQSDITLTDCTVFILTNKLKCREKKNSKEMSRKRHALFIMRFDVPIQKTHTHTQSVSLKLNSDFSS